MRSVDARDIEAVLGTADRMSAGAVTRSEHPDVTAARIAHEKSAREKLRVMESATRVGGEAIEREGLRETQRGFGRIRVKVAEPTRLTTLSWNRC